MRKMIVVSLFSVCMLGLASCDRPLTRGEKGAVIGGGAGAVIGGVAGGGTGAAIGAVGGAIVGGAIGHSTRKKCKVYYRNGRCKQY